MDWSDVSNDIWNYWYNFQLVHYYRSFMKDKLSYYHKNWIDILNSKFPFFFYRTNSTTSELKKTYYLIVSKDILEQLFCHFQIFSFFIFWKSNTFSHSAISLTFLHFLNLWFHVLEHFMKYHATFDKNSIYPFVNHLL